MGKKEGLKRGEKIYSITAVKFVKRSGHNFQVSHTPVYLITYNFLFIYLFNIWCDVNAMLFFLQGMQLNFQQNV